MMFPQEIEEAKKELERRALLRQELMRSELDKDGILKRLNDAANMAKAYGNPKDEAAILMQIAKFMGYLDKN